MKSSRRGKEKDMVGIEKSLSKTRIAPKEAAASASKTRIRTKDLARARGSGIGSADFGCSYCNISFLTFQALSLHHEKSHPLNKFSLAEDGGRKKKRRVSTCQFCEVSFTTLEALILHRQTRHFWVTKPPIDKEKSEKFLRSIREPAERTAGGLYMCITCSNCFKTNDDYDHHKSACVEAEVNAKDDDIKEGHDEFWLEDEGFVEQSSLYASEALEYFNSLDGGKRYELVESGPVICAGLYSCIFHTNFKAKENGCPSAQVETFFAEVKNSPYLKVVCCVSLGPSVELPHWSEAYLGHCTRCDGWVNHPTKRIHGVTWEPVESDY